ncbi:MAG TPA: hypothetical protein VM260_13390 [Pirellula sp.]|nr:hypothetical protein [Pirellula sp.]
MVGFTVSFSLPKPQSRLSLIDLPTGKAIHTIPVEADMCPLCLLNDGSAALMFGTGDDRKGSETPAEKMLAQAQTDPSVFLIHPGVDVSIDASGAGQYSAQVASSLRSAAQDVGYRIVAGSPILIVGSVSGPKQEAVSYIANGAYIANVYQSNIRIVWQGKDLWSNSGNNIPGFLQTKRNESIQEKLNELGKTPNLTVFEKTQFPKLLQRPASDVKSPNRSEALMTSRLTTQGLVDSK